MIDKVLLMQNNTETYKRTDLLITFTLQGLIPASVADNAYYNFSFPKPETLTAFTVCTVNQSMIMYIGRKHNRDLLDHREGYNFTNK